MVGEDLFAVRVGHSLIAYWDGIAALCRVENKVSLGFVEGLNNKNWVIQRRAYVRSVRRAQHGGGRDHKAEVRYRSLPGARGNPILTAKEVATLDAFSGGRFLFGIDAGWLREESEILGVDFSIDGRKPGNTKRARPFRKERTDQLRGSALA